MVEDVEDFRPELCREALRNRDVLKEGEVELVVSRPSSRIRLITQSSGTRTLIYATGRGVFIDGNCGFICQEFQLAWLVEGGGIAKPEGLANCGWSLADVVAKLLTLALNLDVIAAGILCRAGRAIKRDWLTTLECVDEVGRPPTDQGVCRL